jgi:uncharacterized protein
MLLQRNDLEKQIVDSLESSPITILLGPRQCGKTTIARLIAEKRKSYFFDLENPSESAGLHQSPMLTLESLEGLIVLDEIQRVPGLLPVLRVLADRAETKANFLILGSASPQLIKQASESLAGRLSFVDMSGFSIRDFGVANWKKAWMRGTFPRSYLAKSENHGQKWREDFIRTFLERDIPQMGITIPAAVLQRFWTMTAHYHGQVWNGSEFARSIGATEPTARKYVDILSDAYVVRQLQPWHENLKKRQVKSPKIYIRDSGILHTLISLKGNQILSHPKLGASWEGFIIEQILDLTKTRGGYFWATHSGAELDLFIIKSGKRIGFEIKYTDAPSRTRSMTIAQNDLKLDRLYVIYPGTQSFQIDKKIQAVGIGDLLSITDLL